jgi:hypothetical protein
MNAKVLSRDFAPGKVMKLQRVQRLNPRNPVVYAMAHRAASAGAGKHVRSQGAMRRAEKVSLSKLVRQQEQ